MTSYAHIKHNDLMQYSYRELEHFYREVEEGNAKPEAELSPHLEADKNLLNRLVSTIMIKMQEALIVYKPREVKEIRSLKQLLPVPQIADPALKVLALDLDDTLFGIDSIVSPAWFHWVKNENDNRQFSGDNHKNIYNCFLVNAPKKSIEADELVHQVIDEYKAKGWKVIILTARSAKHLPQTIDHLRQSNLRINAEDIVFTELKMKREPLFKWLQKQPGYSTKIEIQIRFVDDNLSYIEDMDTMNALGGVTAESYRFIEKAAPRPWTENQMENFAIQYYAALQSKPIPKMVNPIPKEALEEAMKALKITAITEEAIYLLSSGQIAQ